MREIVLFDNYDVSARYEDARRLLRDEYPGREITEEEIWERVSEEEGWAWKDMMDELEGKFASFVIVAGSVGRWSGTASGVAVYDSCDMPAWAQGSLLRYILCELGKDCEYFRVSVAGGSVHIQCTHHDGTNWFELRNLSERGYNAWADWYDNVRFTDLSEKEMCDKLFRSRRYYTDAIEVM